MSTIKTVRALQLCHVGWDSHNGSLYDSAEALLSYTTLFLRDKEFTPPDALWYEIALLAHGEENPDKYPANMYFEEE